MKKIIATILTAIMVCSLFAGVVTFADDSLSAALEAAKPELYGFYTAHTGGYLRDCYDRAQAVYQAGGNDNGEAAALSTAITALVPLTNYTRSPLIGFVNIGADDIASMKLNSGSVTAEEGVVTIAGEGTLRYCNAVNGGIAGDNPFGVAVDDCDGFALKISADADAVLDIEVGRRGSAADCVFTLSDVVITAGERYYLFPFDRFGDLPVDGTLNYLSLTFTGASLVSFSDLHAVLAEETAADYEYYETKVTAPTFDSSKYYKITLFDEPDKVFEMVEDTGNGKYMLADPVQGKASQEWQIVKDLVYPSRYRIINRHFGTALFADTTGVSPSLNDIVPNLTDEMQEWSFSYKKKTGFTIQISGVTKMTTTIDGRVRCASAGTVKTFDIYEIPGDNWNLVWSEEFNDGALDRTTWRNRTGKFRPVREPIYHRDNPENIYFTELEDFTDDNGDPRKTLVIHTSTAECPETQAYYQTEGHERDKLATGAYIDTVGNHLFTYGRMEICARLPEGIHIWPAGWMMGTSTMGWAACGELDIIEMLGDAAKLDDTSPIATIHCMADSGVGYTQGSHATGKMRTDDVLANAFHTYAVEWDSENIRWFWDDVMFFCMPIDVNQEQYSFLSNPMYLILNTSIDTSKYESEGVSYLPDDTVEESFYYIDYIHYYKKSKEAAPQADAPVDTYSSFAFYEPSSEIENVMVGDGTGDKAFVTGKSNTLQLYDIPTGRLENSRRANYADCPWSGAVSPDGTKYVVIEQGGNDRVSGTMAGRILVYDSSFNLLRVIEGSYASCAECAITPDNKYLVVFGRPHSTEGRSTAKNVYVFDLDTGEIVMQDPYDTYGRELVMAPDGRFAASGTDGNAKLYGTDFTCIATLNNDILVSSMAFSGDSSKLATCNTCGVVRIWDAATGELLNTIDGPGEYDILSAALNADGSRVVLGCSDFCTRLFDVATGKLVKRMAGAQSFIANVKYSPDYTVIAAASNDGKIRVYDADGNIRCILVSGRSDTGYADKFLFSADSKHIAAEVFITQKSCIAFWTLPDGIATEKADFSALDELPYYDETAYTAESYAPYAAALKSANAVKANPYSAQTAIDAAAQAVTEAAGGLVEGGEEPPVFIKGDMDGDGEITVADALRALRIAAKLVQPTDEDMLIGDIDGDGEITVADALKILRVAAKLVDSL